MEKNAVLFLAEGFEEVEATTPADYLRRAGIAVTLVAVGGERAVRGARGITVLADITLKELAGAGKAGSGSWDAAVIPGGIPGASNIAASEAACALITEMAEAGKWVCALCASPAVVLAPLGLLAGKGYTCYPGMETGLTEGEKRSAPVVVDGNLITASGAGTAGLFAVEIIRRLCGRAEGDRIAGSVLLGSASGS
ncbi:MAG: DJ-1/PfpI family protein [Treponema sp.]|nr:DJ-1/PfpI family protein [Treponema sp.]